GEQALEHLGHEVRDSDCAHLPIGQELLQRPVRTDGALEVRSQRLMQEQQVDLLNTQFSGRLIKGMQGLGIPVVADPQLRLDEYVRPLQARGADALADLTLIPIRCGEGDPPVADPQRVSHSRRGLLRGSLDSAEAQSWHSNTVVQGDVLAHNCHARPPVRAEVGTISTPLARPRQPSRRPGCPAAVSSVAARLPSSFSRSSVGEPGWAVNANMNQSALAGNSIA